MTYLAAFTRFLAKSRSEKAAAIRTTCRHLLKIGRPVSAEHLLAHHRWAAPATIHANLPFYVALRPDSDWAHHCYPELDRLSELWVRGNAAPNATDLPRLYAFALNIRKILEENLPGDFAELGVYRGNSAAVLAHYARSTGRQLYLFDTFAGFDQRDLIGCDGARPVAFADTTLADVRKLVGEQNVHFLPGHFPETIPRTLDHARFSAVHLDCDLYAPIKAGMEFFFPRLSPGGLMIVHDYSGIAWGGVRRAVDEFLLPRPERPVLMPDRSGSAIIRKNIAT